MKNICILSFMSFELSSLLSKKQTSQNENIHQTTRTYDIQSEASDQKLTVSLPDCVIGGISDIPQKYSEQNNRLINAI